MISNRRRLPQTAIVYYQTVMPVIDTSHLFKSTITVIWKIQNNVRKKAVNKVIYQLKDRASCVTFPLKWQFLWCNFNSTLEHRLITRMTSISYQHVVKINEAWVIKASQFHPFSLDHWFRQYNSSSYDVNMLVVYEYNHYEWWLLILLLGWIIIAVVIFLTVIYLGSVTYVILFPSMHKLRGCTCYTMFTVAVEKNVYYSESDRYKKKKRRDMWRVVVVSKLVFIRSSIWLSFACCTRDVVCLT